jgi:glycosyltransferase involved in cell wall biosynthesis
MMSGNGVSREFFQMQEQPLVSVVIATYNMAKYLPLAIQSALDQTYGNMEVLVIDDGSGDDTCEAIAAFAHEPRVKYWLQENKGQAAAKNHGIRKASGDYIAFLDADDTWEPEKLELQMPLLMASKRVGLVYSRLAYLDENGNKKGAPIDKLFRGQISGPLLINNFVAFGSCLVRRECFERMGHFRENVRMGIDYDLWLRFSTNYEFDYVDRPLLNYRVWGGQMSNNCRGRYENGIAIMTKFLIEYPEAVDKSTQNEAWAHTYVGFGKCMYSIDRRIGPALILFARALRYKPDYIPAWKEIAATMLQLRKNSRGGISN